MEVFGYMQTFALEKNSQNRSTAPSLRRVEIFVTFHFFRKNCSPILVFLSKNKSKEIFELHINIFQILTVIIAVHLNEQVMMYDSDRRQTAKLDKFGSQ